MASNTSKFRCGCQLSGSDDQYAEAVKAHLPNSLHLVARGQGHSVTGTGCLGRLVAEFIEAASVSGLDAACADRIQAAPWFMSLTGPQP